jgi:hypothetical protein
VASREPEGAFLSRWGAWFSDCAAVLQAYHGGLQHVRDPSARASRVHKVIDRAAAAVGAISKRAGLQCQVVTGGGSGTYRVEAASGVFTEVQPGAHKASFNQINNATSVAMRFTEECMPVIHITWFYCL